MAPVRAALAARAALLVFSTGYAGIVVGQGSYASPSSKAMHDSSLRQLFVSGHSSVCVRGQEFQSCLSSCRFRQSSCTTKVGANCTKTTIPCTAPNCCSIMTLHGTSYNLTTCSKSCCRGLDDSGNPVPAASCMPVLPEGAAASPGHASGPSRKGSATTAASPSTASPKAASSMSSNCFPARATVELESGTRLRMDELRVGDRVRVGEHTFSDVFLFTHKLELAAAEVLVIQTVSGHSVSMTPGHYVYVYINGLSLVPAASVRVGDELKLASGARSAVASVASASQAGIYNPQTLHGDIVVDGICCSTYTAAVSPALGHAWLAPLRVLYSGLGVSTSSLEGGAAESAVRLLPRGPAVL